MKQSNNSRRLYRFLKSHKAASFAALILIVISSLVGGLFFSGPREYTTSAHAENNGSLLTSSFAPSDLKAALPPGTHPCPPVPGKVLSTTSSCGSVKVAAGPVSLSTRCPSVAGKHLSSSGTSCRVNKLKPTKTSGRLTVMLPSGATACPSVASKKSSSTASCRTTSTNTGQKTTSTYSVSLSADTTALPPGSSTTLTATANVDIGTTPYDIEIFDQGSGSILAACATGSSCSISVNDSSAETLYFIAYIADFGTTNPPPNIQATSNVLSVTWLEVTLSADYTTLGVGSYSTLTATANTDIGPTPYYIEIFDQSISTFLADCTSGTSCSTSYIQSTSGTQAFVAYISDYGKTYPPPNIQVNSNTINVSWQPWSITLSANPSTPSAGNPTILVATSNFDVGPSSYYIEFFDQSTSSFIAECPGGTICSTSVTASNTTTQTYIVYVSDNDTVYPPTGIQAASQTQNVTWLMVQNALPYPSWWSGVCDNNNYSSTGVSSYTLPKGAAIPASYRGVVACGPRRIGDGGPDHLVHFFNTDTVGAYEWECVELSLRFMYQAYGINPYSGNGDQLVNNYNEAANPVLHKVTNNGSTQTVPQPGDILSYNTSLSGGHTSVVIATDVNSTGKGIITVLEQNFSPTGIALLKVGTKTPWVIAGGVTGWLHHRVDLSPQSGPPTTKVKITGTGFTPNETVSIAFDVTSVGTVKANSSGAISKTITVPVSQRPGRYTIKLTGLTSGFSPKTVYYVLSNWYLFGHDLAHTHFNPNENVVGASNVSNLVLDWKAPTNYVVFTTPAIVNGVVYFGSGGGNLYALNAATGQTLWTASTVQGTFSSPAVAYGVVYAGSDDGNLYAFNTTTGKTVWTVATGGGIFSSPAVANGVVYVGSEDGKLYAFSAATGQTLWTATTGALIDSSPAVANGVVYVGSEDGKLYAFSAATGQTLWTATTGALIDSSPTVVNGVVYIGSYDGKLYAFNAAGCGQTSCSPLWTATTGNVVYSSPAVANGVVYVGSGDSKLYAFNAAGCGQTSCSPLWTATTGNGIQSSPTVANGVVYVGSDDHNLYAFNAAGCGQTSCSPLWTYATSDFVQSSPAVANGVIYVGSNDANLYAFHLPGTIP